MNHKLYKLLHWEYWPEYLVYWPAWLFWPYYAVRLKSVFFFSLANPGIRNGGIMDIDKYFLYQQIHLKYLPKSILLKPTDDCCKIELLNQYNLALPLIAKPNNGYRGKKVEKIITLEQLNAYHLATNFDYLLQEFCNLPDEIGVFYCKLPHQEIGTITGIVHKQFMQVVGDGINTVKHLIKANPRYAFQLNRLSATIDMQSIPYC